MVAEDERPVGPAELLRGKRERHEEMSVLSGRMASVTSSGEECSVQNVIDSHHHSVSFIYFLMSNHSTSAYTHTDKAELAGCN